MLRFLHGRLNEGHMVILDVVIQEATMLVSIRVVR